MLRTVPHTRRCYGAVMVWLGLVLFTSIAVAMLRGGRLLHLAEIHLRMWWLLLLGFSLQFARLFLPADADWAFRVGVSLLLVSYVLLIAVVIVNRDRTGMWLTGLGIIMNFTVIALNGGMPVLGEAAQVAGGFVTDVSILDDQKHVLLDHTSRLTFLADVIPLRAFGVGQVLSIGDVFLAVGLGAFLESELRKPIHWFKRGAGGQAGSATSS